MLNRVILVYLSYFTELEWWLYLDASTWETGASLCYKGKLSQSFIIKKLNISLPCFWLIVPPEKPRLKHPYLRPRRSGHSARSSRPLLWNPPGRKAKSAFLLQWRRISDTAQLRPDQQFLDSIWKYPVGQESNHVT